MALEAKPWATKDPWVRTVHPLASAAHYQRTKGEEGHSKGELGIRLESPHYVDVQIQEVQGKAHPNPR